MTVLGKGGRPRKWRSDADRVRAYRARQAGRDEPPELDQALAHGDELARAMEEIRALRAELVAAADTEQLLRQEVRSVRRELAARDRRFGWLERAAEATRAAKEVAEQERDALTRRLRELEARDRVAVSRTPRHHEPNVVGKNESNGAVETDRPIRRRATLSPHAPRWRRRTGPRDGPRTLPGSRRCLGHVDER